MSNKKDTLPSFDINHPKVQAYINSDEFKNSVKAFFDKMSQPIKKTYQKVCACNCHNHKNHDDSFCKICDCYLKNILEKNISN